MTPQMVYEKSKAYYSVDSIIDRLYDSMNKNPRRIEWIINCHSVSTRVDVARHFSSLGWDITYLRGLFRPNRLRVAMPYPLNGENPYL